jgi:enterochelin esterase family protein
VFLDAELYLERVGAAQVVESVMAEGRIPSLKSIFVSSDSPAARHSDYVCDSDYSRFLTEELLPFVLLRDPDASVPVAIVGLSLSALAAAHAALITRRFQAAICQSPSFWWNGEQLASSIPRAGSGATAFWVSVGDLETESGVSHPPSGLFQGTSQRDSCNRGSIALQAAGYSVSHRVFRGGHDPVCWRDDLALALPWATSAWPTRLA